MFTSHVELKIKTFSLLQLEIEFVCMIWFARGLLKHKASASNYPNDNRSLLSPALQHFINPGQCQMTPVTGCSVKWKVQMRSEKCLPQHKPNFLPGCVCVQHWLPYAGWRVGTHWAWCWSCAVPCVPLSSLVWAAARRVKTLAHCCGLQRAESYLVRAVQ